MQLLRNILAWMPCGKPQAAHFAHLVELLQWLPERVNFTNLEHCGGWSVRTHARWFARAVPFARLAVAALGILRPRPVGELLALDASFVPKSGDRTWGLGWFWSGMARAARRGLEVSLLAVVDVEAGGAYPLCARQSPGATPSRREACGAAPGRETTVDAGLALLRAAVDAGAKAILRVRWVAADGGYSTKTFVEGVRALGLHTVGRLRRDMVLRFRYTGPHARRPGRKRQFDGGFDRRDPARMARTTLKKEKVDLYYAKLHSKAWQCWQQVVYVLPRGADPRTKEGCSCTARTLNWRRNASSASTAPASRLSLPSATPSSTWASTTARPVPRPSCTFISTWFSRPSSGRACRPGSGRRVPRTPFPCAISSATTSRRRSANELAQGRLRAETPPMPGPAAAAFPRTASGCGRPLVNRGRPAPEHGSRTGPTHRLRPQNVSEP